MLSSNHVCFGKSFEIVWFSTFTFSYSLCHHHPHHLLISTTIITIHHHQYFLLRFDFNVMERRICSLLVIAIIQILSWVSATSRPLAPNGHGLDLYQPEPESVSGKSPQSLPIPSDTKFSPKQGIVNEEAAAAYMSKIGSSPPSCENKCYGCNPCEAIQVPATNAQHSHGHAHLDLQYANYEPEGWKCKCGPSLYSP